MWISVNTVSEFRERPDFMVSLRSPLASWPRRGRCTGFWPDDALEVMIMFHLKVRWTGRIEARWPRSTQWHWLRAWPSWWSLTTTRNQRKWWPSVKVEMTIPVSNHLNRRRWRTTRSGRIRTYVARWDNKSTNMSPGSTRTWVIRARRCCWECWRRCKQRTWRRWRRRSTYVPVLRPESPLRSGSSNWTHSPALQWPSGCWLGMDRDLRGPEVRVDNNVPGHQVFCRPHPLLRACLRVHQGDWEGMDKVPKYLRVDEAKGWASQALRDWTSAHGVTLEVAPAECHNWLGWLSGTITRSSGGPLSSTWMTRASGPWARWRRPPSMFRHKSKWCLWGDSLLISGWLDELLCPLRVWPLLFNPSVDPIDEQSEFACGQQRRLQAQQAFIKADSDAKLRRAMMKNFRESKKQYHILVNDAGTGVIRKPRFNNS